MKPKFDKFKKILPLGLFVFLTNCHPTNTWSESPDQSTFSLDPRDTVNSILNGEEVTANDPFATSIVGVINLEKGSLCTGTLITREYVLTAAHCLGHSVTSLRVFTGLSKKQTSAVLDVVSTVVTPEWETRSSEIEDRGDLAILKITGDLPNIYRPIQLGTAPPLEAGSEVFIVGYGRNDGVAKAGAGTLRKGFALIANPQHGHTEVLLDQRNGKGACHGDSGGPALVVSPKGLFQWGVTSREFQDPQKDCTHFSIYTKIDSYLEWIRLNTQN